MVDSHVPRSIRNLPLRRNGTKLPGNIKGYDAKMDAARRGIVITLEADLYRAETASQRDKKTVGVHGRSYVNHQQNKQSNMA